MSAAIPQSEFTKGLHALLTEAFESVQGYFLDPHTSLFETLATVSAVEASRPVSERSWRPTQM